jgi:hypothetical protein
MGRTIEDLVAASEAIRTHSDNLRLRDEAAHEHSRRIVAYSARLLADSATIHEESERRLRAARAALDRVGDVAARSTTSTNGDDGAVV